MSAPGMGKVELRCLEAIEIRGKPVPSLCGQLAGPISWRHLGVA